MSSSGTEASDLSWRIECRSNTWSHQRRRRRQMMRAQQQCTPTETLTLTLSDLSDSASPDPKRMRLDPSSFGTEDSGSKSSTVSQLAENETPVRDGCVDETTTPNGTKSNPTSLGNGDSSITTSDVVDLVNPVTSVPDLISTEDSSLAVKTWRLDPVPLRTEDKDSSCDHKDSISDSDVGSTESKAVVTDNAGDAFIMVCSVTVRKVDFVKLEMSWIDGSNRELMHQLMQFFRNRLI